MKRFTEKEINETFKKLNLKKQPSKKIDYQKKETELSPFEQADIWIVADSGTSFED